ncbi:hypothetical protein CMV30_06175 [Nibricoccus aquaticus]|uniref:Uncharacterized protein n=1 Tax=Nibricoccus aquaticus TaxID=2576891 RepID=A0A290Q561_9BACT|nr:hypothetical protein [Nibricoccus aquaticus]ATC63573.1 hypothetical protein CMV30_06175 [Nibricoccus aquaticus]
MADSVEQSKWGKFIGETTAITVIGSVLYFWGRAYTNQLVRSSGFPAELFEFSLYDVLFSTWLPVILSLIYGVGVAFLWYTRYFYGTLICWILVGPLYVLLWPFRFIQADKLRPFGKRVFLLIDRIVQWLKRHTPESFLENAEKIDDLIVPKCLAALIAIAFGFGGAVYLEHKAKNDFETLSTALNKKQIRLVHEDGKETTGQQVVSLGGGVILDVTNSSGQINRVLIRGSDIKQVTQLPPLAPKEPSISAAPALK